MNTFLTLIFLMAIPYLFFLSVIKRAIKCASAAQPVEAVITGKWIGGKGMALGLGGTQLSVLQYSYRDESAKTHEKEIYVTSPEWKQYEVSQKIILMKVPDMLLPTSTIYTKASFDSRYNVLKKALKYYPLYYGLGIIVVTMFIFG